MCASLLCDYNQLKKKYFTISTVPTFSTFKASCGMQKNTLGLVACSISHLFFFISIWKQKLCYLKRRLKYCKSIYLILMFVGWYWGNHFCHLFGECSAGDEKLVCIFFCNEFYLGMYSTLSSTVAKSDECKQCVSNSNKQTNRQIDFWCDEKTEATFFLKTSISHAENRNQVS